MFIMYKLPDTPEERFTAIADQFGGHDVAIEMIKFFGTQNASEDTNFEISSDPSLRLQQIEQTVKNLDDEANLATVLRLESFASRTRDRLLALLGKIDSSDPEVQKLISSLFKTFRIMDCQLFVAEQKLPKRNPEE
jgi:hypothetical protein